MKTIALAGAAALAMVAVPVLAQQAPQRPAPQPLTRAALQQMVATEFAKADADRDGFVTKAEVQARKAEARAQRRAKQAERRNEMFSRLDADKNGQISQSEFNARTERAPRGERRAARADRRADRRYAALGTRFGSRIVRADADKDGRVSLAEASARPLARFDRADANKDGTLTPEERGAAFKGRDQRRATRG